MSYKLLELFCCAGGSAMGYSYAGFEIVGSDIDPQPNFPFEFYQDDALHVLDVLNAGGEWNGYVASDFAVVHTSPPCQRYSSATKLHRGAPEKHPDLIGPVRDRLVQWAERTGGLWIIENVNRAPLREPIMLCGAMFGLRTYRHRKFESNFPLEAPDHPKHVVRAAKLGHIAEEGEFWCVGGHFGHRADAAKALGVEWMKTQREISECIPPAYTEYVGNQLIAELMRREEKAA